MNNKILPWVMLFNNYINFQLNFLHFKKRTFTFEMVYFYNLPVKWPSVPLSQPNPEPVLRPPPAPGPVTRCGNFCCRTYIPVSALRWKTQKYIEHYSQKWSYLQCFMCGHSQRGDFISVQLSVIGCVIWLVTLKGVFNLSSTEDL